MDSILQTFLNSTSVKSFSGATAGALIITVTVATAELGVLPFYISLGVFCILSIITMVMLIRQNSNKKKVNKPEPAFDYELYKDIISQIESKGIDTDRLSRYIDELNNEKPDLLKLSLFESYKRSLLNIINGLHIAIRENTKLPKNELKDILNKFCCKISEIEPELSNEISGEILIIKNKIDERLPDTLDEETVIGKTWVIKKFLTIKVETVTERIYDYISSNKNIIYDDFTHLGIDKLISVVYDSVDGKQKGNEGYEVLARENGIPEEFIADFNLKHRYILTLLAEGLKLINTSKAFRYDYEKFAIVIGLVDLAFYETFTDKHIQEIININGRLNLIYKKIGKLIKDGYIK